MKANLSLIGSFSCCMCVIHTMDAAYQNREPYPSTVVQRSFWFRWSQYEFRMDGMPHHLFMDLGKCSPLITLTPDLIFFPIFTRAGRDDFAVFQRRLPVRRLGATVVNSDLVKRQSSRPPPRGRLPSPRAGTRRAPRSRSSSSRCWRSRSRSSAYARCPNQLLRADSYQAQAASTRKRPRCSRIRRPGCYSPAARGGSVEAKLKYAAHRPASNRAPPFGPRPPHDHDFPRPGPRSILRRKLAADRWLAAFWRAPSPREDRWSLGRGRPLPSPQAPAGSAPRPAPSIRGRPRLGRQRRPRSHAHRRRGSDWLRASVRGVAVRA